MTTNKRGPIGHGRRSLRLGARDPRARRESQERAADNTLASNGGLRLDALGRIEINIEDMAEALVKRGFKREETSP